MNNTVNNDQLILIQGFFWNACETPNWWEQVAEKVQTLAAAGFNAIWLPPVSTAADKQGYLPNELYNLNSFYGSQTSLHQLMRSLKQNSFMVIADLVLNHRVGKTKENDFINPFWDDRAIVSDDEFRGKGNPDTGKGFHAGRDLDHTQAFVQQDLITWMRWLKSDCGFDGWRYDYASGFSAEFIKKYNDATQPLFSVGEYWEIFDINNPNQHRQLICDWLDGHQGSASAFDFTTKGLLQWAVANKDYEKLCDHDDKPAGLIGWWPQKAVTFIENHDTSHEQTANQKNWPFPEGEMMQGYAYILTHPGIPCVYWPHYFEPQLKSKIDALISLRKRMQLSDHSEIKRHSVTKSHYCVVIDQKLCLKLGSDHWMPDFNWDRVIDEPNYKVWIKSQHH